MILPITAYGHPVLKKKGEKIDKDYPGLKVLIDDMFETMYYSKGVGLAAQQINKAIRLFMSQNVQSRNVPSSPERPSSPIYL